MSLSEAAVTARGLHKRYGRTVALAGLDLEIPRSSIFGLLGPNGAGKSTTFGIFCGWLRATAGEARVLGVEAHRVHTLRGRVSALPQDAKFPSQIAVASQLAHFGRLVGLDGREARRQACETLERVGLSEVAAMRGNELSHGMLKRVGLAQALIGEPELVFLDEPISGLDPKTARHIKDLIASLAPQATVVLSSHNLSDVEEICSHGAILDQGGLVAAGALADLTRSGSEVAIEIAAGAVAPIDALRLAFGVDSVSQEGTTLRIVLPVSAETDGEANGEDTAANADQAEARIREALRILIDAEVSVLEVRRGTSLEDAFLAATDRGGG